MRRIVVIWMLLLPWLVQGQSIATEFGKNRVQYHNNFKYWSKYETDHFIVYWYGKGKNTAHAVAKLAELDHEEVRKLVEHKINDKIEIVVYMDLADMKQSNIGIEDVFQSKSGETKIEGTKMLVYFDGDHQSLRRQVREGIASVYLSSLIFGNSFQEIVQNAVLFNVPDWYKSGFIAYAGQGWTSESEDLLRNIYYTKDDKNKFDRLAQDYARIMGHSFWHFLAANYGKSSISNILYFSKITRDVEGSFQFVYNTSLDQLKKEWLEYYRQIFDREDNVFEKDASHDIGPRKGERIKITFLAYQPNGHHLAMVFNDKNKLTIKLLNTKTKKYTKLAKLGTKNGVQAVDENYAQLQWDKSGKYLFVLYQKKDRIYLRKYDVESKQYETILLPADIQRVYSFDQADARFFVMSAMIEGYSDLILFDSKKSVFVKITDDYYDDLDVSFTTYNGQKGILFVSNRSFEHLLPEPMTNQLPLDNFDVFFYPLALDIDKEMPSKFDPMVERLSTTPKESERRPLMDSRSGEVVYLSKGSGIKNGYLLHAKAAITNSSRNIITHCIDDEGQYYYTKMNDDRHHLYKKNMKDTTEVYITNFDVNTNFVLPSIANQVDSIEEQRKPSTTKFQSDFPDPIDMQPIRIKDKNQTVTPQISHAEVPKVPSNQTTDLIPFHSYLITAAGLKFKLDQITTRFDNEVLFEGLEIFEGNKNQVNNLAMGFLVKGIITDIFEDYKIELGVRIPTNLNGSELFIKYSNRKKQLDKSYGLYRRTVTDEFDGNRVPIFKTKKETIIANYQLKYPLSVYTALKLNTALRWDKRYEKATELASFNSPITNEKRLGVRMEYVFDNSLPYAVNILHGSRAKLYLDLQNQFDLQVVDGFSIDASKGFTGVLGLDVRHYISVLRHSVLALRGASAYSFGGVRNIYYLGDVNNTLVSSFEQTPLPEGDFAYKTNINNLRGFGSNIRNGTTFLVGNVEYRVPLFMYLLGKNKGSSIIRNFQVVGFLDAGMAWHGSSPFSAANPINSVYVDGPTVDIQLEYFRDPLVVGYGFGFRTSMLGYYIKVDIAHGIETRVTQPVKYHFSFGYDF